MIGHGHAVDLRVGEVVARLRRDVRIVTEEPRGLRRNAVAVGGERVVPVPSVERRMRHERAETAAEGQCRRHDGDRQYRADERRAHRGRVAVDRRFEREADADDRGHGESEVGGEATGARTQRRGRAFEHDSRTAEIVEAMSANGDRAEENEQQRAKPKPSTGPSKAKPPSG